MLAPARKNLTVFFSLMLVLASCFTMGCSTQTPAPQPNETKKGTDFGFRLNTVSQKQQALSFREVTANLADLQLVAGNDTAANDSQENKILYVRGVNLNEKGEAKSWTFVVHHNNRTSIVTCDQFGINIVTWMGDFPQRESLLLDAIITPEDLFLKNRAAIIRDEGENLTESRDLVLSMDNYTLTLSGKGAKRILVFDAKTGALVRSSG